MNIHNMQSIFGRMILFMIVSQVFVLYFNIITLQEQQQKNNDGPHHSNAIQLALHDFKKQQQLHPPIHNKNNPPKKRVKDRRSLVDKSYIRKEEGRRHEEENNDENKVIQDIRKDDDDDRVKEEEDNGEGRQEDNDAGKDDDDRVKEEEEDNREGRQEDNDAEKDDKVKEEEKDNPIINSSDTNKAQEEEEENEFHKATKTTTTTTTTTTSAAQQQQEEEKATTNTTNTTTTNTTTKTTSPKTPPTLPPTTTTKKYQIQPSELNPLLTGLDPNAKALPFLPKSIEYLGILLDAGRHYFPLPWIYNLLDLMHLMGYNLLHFRFTDDQAFHIRLDSHPGLAQPAHHDGGGSQVYTPNELRQLVQYARSKDITIMPEINIPGHAGAWAHAEIPNLIVPCAAFICDKGYGLPLNVSHPALLPLLEDILREIKDIFDVPPPPPRTSTTNTSTTTNTTTSSSSHSFLLHLGGDEVEMSQPCFNEVNSPMLDYHQFEIDLGIILNKLNISHDSIVRWEMTGQDRIMRKNGGKSTRIKGIDHYWMSYNYQRERTMNKNLEQAALQAYMEAKKNNETTTTTPETNATNATNVTTTTATTTNVTTNVTTTNTTIPKIRTETAPVFCSTGLYFDTNQMDNGYHIYTVTSEMIIGKKGRNPMTTTTMIQPRGIIAGTFELGVNYWMDRNVIGRLLATAMGASVSISEKENDNNRLSYDVFSEEYQTYCQEYLKLPMEICSLEGLPPIPYQQWRNHWYLTQADWITDLCHRLTTITNETSIITMKKKPQQRPNYYNNNHHHHQNYNRHYYLPRGGRGRLSPTAQANAFFLE